jgi:hypothetical protein
MHPKFKQQIETYRESAEQ